MIKSEYWDIINADGTPTGKRIRRSSFNHLSHGQYHLVVHIWIIDSKGNYLLQRRSEHREPMSGEWAATGGSVISGETSSQAAVRELSEELGINVKECELHYIARTVRKNSVVDIWKVGVDVGIDSLQLQSEEVMDAKWVTEQEFKQLIADGQFHNYGQDYFNLIFK